MFNLQATFRDRLKIAPSPSSVDSSLPVLFFGDAVKARVATIGLNPSKYEYLDRAGNVLCGSTQRFSSTVSLGVEKRDDITTQLADTALEYMRSYFDPQKPVYSSYFRHLSNFLKGMQSSYVDRTVAHLDLIQEATDPIWSHLPIQEQLELLERDLPFLVWQLANLPNLEVVICAGATVSRKLRSRLIVQETNTGKMKRLQWWSGTMHVEKRSLKVGGWNYPLDRPTGLGTKGEIELGSLLMEELDWTI